MKKTLLLTLLFCATPAVAQVPPFGSAFPLTNTRYGHEGGTPLVRTDGKNAFLFWAGRVLWVTRLATGERHLSRPVFEAGSNGFDAAWVDDHFVVAAAAPVASPARIEGRIVDRNGNATGAAFTIADGASQPQLAYNGSTLLLVYSRGGKIEAMPLDRFGRPTALPEVVDDAPATTARVIARGMQFVITVPKPDGARLMGLDAGGRRISDTPLSDNSAAPLPLATDGSRFIVLSQVIFNNVVSLYDANGTPVRQLTMVGEPGVLYDAHWTGSGWRLLRRVHGTLRVDELDAEVTRVTASQDIGLAYSAAFARVNDRVVVAWRVENQVFTTDLPFRADRVEDVAFAPASQRLLATAASNDGLLVVWAEPGDGHESVHAGIRDRAGNWRESEIAAPSFANRAIAASDGREFVVILNSQQLIRLGANGVPLGPSTTLDFIAFAMAWNGRNYGLIGAPAGVGGFATALLSPAGTLSTPKPYTTQRYLWGCNALASDGDGFYATCGIMPQVIYTGSPPAGVAGLRFDSQGALTGETILRDQVIPVLPTGLAWDGLRYVAAWREYQQVMAAVIAPSSARIQAIGQDSQGLVAVDRNVIGWSDASSQFQTAIVNADGSIAPYVTLRDATAPDAQAFARIGGGPLTRVFSARSGGAPHHGEPHVMMQVRNELLAPEPEAPVLKARKDASMATLQWSAPPRTVSGYRIEYAINDGVWVELEGWFDATRTLATVPMQWPDATYSFRVRAFSDAGAGAYSNIISLMPAKRRSVR